MSAPCPGPGQLENLRQFSSPLGLDVLTDLAISQVGSSFNVLRSCGIFHDSTPNSKKLNRNSVKEPCDPGLVAEGGVQGLSVSHYFPSQS